MLDLIKREANFLLQGAKKVQVIKVSRKRLITDLVCNAVAGVIASAVYMILKLIFKVRTPVDAVGERIGSILGISIRKKSTILIDKATYDWISWIIIFVIGIFVFTYVEQVMENYFKEREKGEKSKPNQII